MRNGRRHHASFYLEIDVISRITYPIMKFLEEVKTTESCTTNNQHLLTSSLSFHCHGCLECIGVRPLKVENDDVSCKLTYQSALCLEKLLTWKPKTLGAKAKQARRAATVLIFILKDARYLVDGKERRQGRGMSKSYLHSGICQSNLGRIRSLGGRLQVSSIYSWGLIHLIYCKRTQPRLVARDRTKMRASCLLRFYSSCSVCFPPFPFACVWKIK